MTTTERPTGMSAFTIIWSGQLVSVLGTRMTNFALSIWVWQETGRACDLTVMVLLAFGATVVCSPLVGPLIDRWPRRLSIVLSDAGTMLVTAVLVLLFLSGGVQIWHLYLANVAMGAFVSVQQPAYAATITVMMEKAHYPRANAMLSMVQAVPGVLAPGAAAVLLGLADIEAVLVADFLTYMVAIATVYAIAIPSMTSGEDSASEGFWRDTVFGFRYMLRRPAMLGLEGILFAVSVLAAMGWIVLIPMVLARTGSETQLGIIQSIGAAGGIVGAAAVAFLRPPPRKVFWMLGGILVFSVLGRIALGLGDTVLVWSLAWFTAWLAIPFIDGYGQSIWQERVEPAVQGRVFAARAVLDNISMPLALGVTGPLVDHLLEPNMRENGSLVPVFGWLVGSGPGAGMAVVFVFSGLLGVLVAVTGFALRPIRHVEDQAADPSVAATPVAAHS